MLIWRVVPLAVVAAAAWWLRRSGRVTDSGRSELRIVLAALQVVVPVGTLVQVVQVVQVVLIGHSGAKAAWGDVGSAGSSPSSSDGDGD
jgi:hypothetical protein